jgi:hypothetical protein
MSSHAARGLVLGLVLACASGFAACVASHAPRETDPDQPMPIEPDTREAAILAYFLEEDHRGPERLPHENDPVSISIWADGTIIWSAAANGLGAPYRRAHLGSAACTGMRDRLQSWFAAHTGSSLTYCVPDGSSEVIRFRKGTSCDELSAYVGYLTTKAPNDPEFAGFRKSWDATKAELRALVRPPGEELPLAEFEYACNTWPR